jgi:RNA polymerase sigma-70 factor, ECF subfamily
MTGIMQLSLLAGTIVLSMPTSALAAENIPKNAGIESDVDRALLHLSIRQQAIFDLHYKKGMTHSEIANALDLPLGTVKSDLRRGLEMLKQYLEDWRIR